MNQRHLAFLAMASASVCAVVFTACGGDDNANTDSGGNDATTNDVVGNDSPQGTDTGTDTGGGDAGSDVVAIDTGCAPGPNCQACCLQKYPDAAAFVVATEMTCGCTTPGMCNTNQTCKNNFCSGQAPSTNCTACLNDQNSGDCRNKAGQACIADQGCQPLAICVTQCAAVTDAGDGGG